MALSAVLFALMGFFARVASAHASWALVAAVRAAIGAGVAFAVGRARGARLQVRDRRGIWLRSIFGTIALACTFYAVGSPAISLGDAATLTNLTPVFVALLAPIFLRERVGKRVAIALPLSIVGVVLVLRPAFVFGGASHTAATYVAGAAALTAALSAAFAMLMLRRISPHETPESIALHYSLFAAVTCGIIAVPGFAVPSGRDAACMLASGVCAGFGQLAMTRAYALARAARVSGLSYVTIAVAALLGVTFLGEQPSPQALGGMALVIVGGLVVAIGGDLRQ
jgi:drug/metabolite transporter (DMT)-like permease